jgi:hypothetical protein
MAIRVRALEKCLTFPMATHDSSGVLCTEQGSAEHGPFPLSNYKLHITNLRKSKIKFFILAVKIRL